MNKLEKYCTNCNKYKFIEEFYKNAIWCKLCRKQYNIDNKEKIKEYSKNYNSKDIQKKFYNKNKLKFFKYKKERRKNDPLFKLKENLRRRVYSYIKNNFKIEKSIIYLGCSIEEYKLYLESQFTSEMTWENYGTIWEIDHIKPLFSFDFSIKENYEKAFHFSNTRPLLKFINQSRPKKYIC